ncbi:hypothetical protein JMM81_08250 [Bacillus sp. V3B]|uniref:hypothetical protein n=1 Tax=Bacillus sp. V3B TaxID=2804915 RepID=UPI00210B45E4|nr:hypothetical protein [Bacillus sp. V3B]MCQ6274953.1 hypothetical protein [Bacillus sp. V3B]
MDHFVSLTKEKIVELISYAEFQVVYTAPAMDYDVANEIVQFAKRTCIDQVAVHLDLSADVYREGFGDEDALDTLLKEGIRVTDIQGLRVGVLLVDDKGWVFSPTSKLTLRNGKVQQKNAILQGGEKEDRLFEGTTTQEETLGKERVERLKKELKEQPLPNFDLQRLLSEYRCLIQFVEITFKGAHLGQTTIKIPSELLNVTKKKGFEDKMKASYRLFDEDFLKITKPLKGEVDDLRERYTRALSKNYGRVILMKNKVEFEKEYQVIMKKMEQYKIDLNHQVHEQIQRTKQELMDYFTPVIMENPPEHLLQWARKPKEQEVKNYIDWLLGREIPTSEQVLKRIEFYYVFKDITEEILKDTHFYRELEKAFKDEYMYWPHQKQNQVEFSL